MEKPNQIDWETMFECLEKYKDYLLVKEPQATHEIAIVDELLQLLSPEVDEYSWE